MIITIGRDQATMKMAYTISDSMPPMSVKGAMVNNTVSRNHCELNFIDGQIALRNLSPRNVTWVDGAAVEVAGVRMGQRVELGYDHFLLDWSMVDLLLAEWKKKQPREVDITHLEQVWNDYHAALGRLQSSQAMLNVYRGGVPLLTIGGVAVIQLGRAGDSDFSGMMPLIYGAAAILMALFFVKSFRDAKRIPREREELQKQFLQDYTCPNDDCRYFFGYQPYDVIRANMTMCPKCKAKLIK